LAIPKVSSALRGVVVSMCIPRSAPFASASRDGLPSAIRPQAQHYHFAGVLFLELQGFLERVGIRLVDLEPPIAFLDPLSGSVDPEGRVARRDLLDRN